MEGLSIALLEALSYGRCVLVSDIPENMEVAEECALSFRSKDVEDLRSKLDHLIHHPEEVERYGCPGARAHRTALLVGTTSPNPRRASTRT
jgi:glycosyltransferase involved in cell wall biosynthesis